MSLFSESKRRNVFKVAAAYILVAWLLLQISDTLVPALHLPEWFLSGVAFLLIMGFPVSIIFAWAFELTPAGIKREKEVERSQSISHETGKKLNAAIIFVLVVAVLFLAGKIWFEGDVAQPGIVPAVGKSIAVLPFQNRSADEEDAGFFAAGVHDELLTLLSKLGDLKVISRTSVERLDQNLSIPEIGTLLGVTTVLEGQVQRAGDRLRINVQLINATKEDHMWAATYDRELTASNIFDVQSDIARSIADELHVHLSAQDDTLLSAVPTRNTEALQYYMLGGQLVQRANFESYKQASEYFSEATVLDPDYAAAWVAIAHVNSSLYQTGYVTLQQYVAVATPSIERALSINSLLPEAHAELATLQWQSGDIDAAEVSFRTALRIDPGNSQSLFSFGSYLHVTGRLQEAIPVLERAVEGSPLSVETIFQLGQSEMYSGMPEQLNVRAAKILEIDPSSMLGYIANLEAYEWIGRYDLMWPWAIRAMASDPDDFELWGYLGLYSNLIGATEWVDRYLGHALELGPREPAVLRVYVEILRFRSQFDLAVEIARGALEEGLDDRWRSNQIFLRLLRDDALRNGNYGAAKFWYLDRHPELFSETLEIRADNVNAAADLALLLQRAGETGAAEAIIDAGLAWIRDTQPAGVHGYMIDIVDVEFLALDGQQQAALATLQQAVDDGWRSNWRSELSNETLVLLRDEPRFQQISVQIEEDMVRQLEVIRTLPDMGEFDLRFSDQ